MRYPLRVGKASFTVKRSSGCVGSQIGALGSMELGRHFGSGVRNGIKIAQRCIMCV